MPEKKKRRVWKQDKPGNWEPGRFGWDEPEADMLLQAAKEKLRGQVRFLQESGVDV